MSGFLSESSSLQYKVNSIRGFIEEVEHLLLERAVVDVREQIGALIDTAAAPQEDARVRVVALDAVKVMMLNLHKAVKCHKEDAGTVAMGEAFTMRAAGVHAALIENLPDPKPMLESLLDIAQNKTDTTSNSMKADEISVRNAGARAYQVCLKVFENLLEYQEADELAERKASIRRELPQAMWDAPVRTERPNHGII
jgi:hypothetical protein